MVASSTIIAVARAAPTVSILAGAIDQSNNKRSYPPKWSRARTSSAARFTGLPRRHAIHLGNNKPIEIGLTFPATEVVFSTLVLRLFTQREAVWKTARSARPANSCVNNRPWRSERVAQPALASRKFRAAAMIARFRGLRNASRATQLQLFLADALRAVYCPDRAIMLIPRVSTPAIIVGSTRCLRTLQKSLQRYL